MKITVTMSFDIETSQIGDDLTGFKNEIENFVKKFEEKRVPEKIQEPLFSELDLSNNVTFEKRLLELIKNNFAREVNILTDATSLKSDRAMCILVNPVSPDYVYSDNYLCFLGRLGTKHMTSLRQEVIRAQMSGLPLAIKINDNLQMHCMVHRFASSDLLKDLSSEIKQNPEETHPQETDAQ